MTYLSHNNFKNIKINRKKKIEWRSGYFCFTKKKKKNQNEELKEEDKEKVEIWVGGGRRGFNQKI